MASLNKVLLIGNLTRDPEFKQLSSGQGVCRFGLASNRQFKNKQTGSMVQEVCFVDIDVWGPQAERCNQYLQKGRSVLVEGRLKLDSWQDAEGNKRSKHSIVADRVTFLGSGAQAEDGAEDSAPAQQEFGAAQPAAAEPVKRARPAKKVSESSGMAAEFGANASGEIAFKDEAPFEEDLPF